MKKLSKLLAIITVLSIVAGIIYIPVAAEDTADDFAITEVYARTAADGSLVKDGFLSASRGLFKNTSAYSDKLAFPIISLPDKFLDCGIILSNYKVVTATQKAETADCVTFDINKPSTVYVVNWNSNIPSWVNEEWSTSDGSDFKVLNTENDTVLSAKMIYEKHFDVTDGKCTVSIGAVSGNVRYFTIVVRPDDLASQPKYPFSEADLKNENLEKDVLSQIGSGTVLYKNINYGYVNSKKTLIDITGEVEPVIENGTTFVPLRFLAEGLGGLVTYNEATSTADITLNGKNFILDLKNDILKNLTENKEIKISKMMVNNRTLVPLRVISENSGFNVMWYDGLIVVSNNVKELSDTLINKISSLFITPINELDLRLKYAKPGDTIYIKEGTYYNVSLNINAKGADGKPITIKASNPQNVQFKGSAKVLIKGEYVTLDGFYFNEIALRETPMISMAGGIEHGRITNCYFYKCRTSSAGGSLIDMTNHSAYNRVDHNIFEAAESLGISIGGVYAPAGDNSKVYHNRIDHNYFKDFKAVGKVWPGTSNGMEPIRVGGTGMFDLYTDVSYNIFENIIADGSEIISNKSNYSTIKYNTFINNYGSGVCLRGGNNADVYGNFFINGRSGIRIYDHSHKVFDNYFYNIYRDAIRISTTDNDGYAHLNNLVVANNTVINPGWGGIILGDKLNNQSTYVLPPDNIKIANNLVVAMKGHAVRNTYLNKNDFSNNIISAYGNGSNEEAKKIGGENNDFSDISLTFDGIFVPSDMSKVTGKGKYVENVNAITGRETFDIGVNDINGKGREGLLTVYDVGPINKWWIPHLRQPAANYRDIEPDCEPQSYTSAMTSVDIPCKAEYDIMNLGGYATYENGNSYTINPEKVSYEIIEGKDVISISGNTIKGLKEGNAKIRATYKGKTSLIDVNTYDKTHYVSQEGNWEISEGRISGQTTGAKSIIDKGSFVDSDFTLNFKYTAGEGNFDAYVILGDKGYKIQNSIPMITEYAINDTRYIIGFGTNETTSGIFRYDGWNNTKLASMLVPNDDNLEHQIEIIYDGSIITVKCDGKTVSVAETVDEIKGSIGFGAYTSKVEFKDISLKKEEVNKKETHISTLNLKTEVPVYEYLTVSCDRLVQKDVIYKLYTNDVFVLDSFEPVFYNNHIDVYDEYRYTIKAFDKEGILVAEGSTVYNGTREPEGEFYFNNIQAKMGPDESYIKCDYLNGSGVPDFMQSGFSEESVIFSDRVYTYENVPEEFLDGAYIQPNYQLRADTYYKRDTLNDFLKFDVHNKSVTIYIVVFATNPPGWLYDQQWTVVRYPIGFWQNTTTVKKADYVYRKRFEVGEGQTRTITLGGIGSNATFAYGVIIVPDKE